MNELEKKIIEENITFEKNVSLKRKTWLKRGGETNFWIKPNCVKQLESVLIFLYSNKIQFEIIGNSSNCYFTETYNPMVTISTTKVNDFEIYQDTIICGCGYKMIKLSKYCIQNGISGFEGFIRLPGTVGGAAINNSGCYGSIMSEVVKGVNILNEDNSITYLSNDELEYKHRTSALKKRKKGIVLSVVFDASRKDEVDKMKEKAEKYIMHRKKNQENKYLNLGSIHSEIKWDNSFWNIRYLVYRIFTKITGKIIPNYSVQISNYILFLLYFKPSLNRNVSDKSLNSFIWKNKDLSDKDFFNYLNFFKKNAKTAVLEIEIKK